MALYAFTELNEGIIFGEESPLLPLVELDDSDLNIFSLPNPFPLDAMAEGENSNVSDSFKFPFIEDSCI